MLSKRNRKNIKKYKGGSPALTEYIDSKPTFTEITKEMVDLYGYPKNYIGYNVALTKYGAQKPFTIPEMCELCWASKTPLLYEDIDSPVNQARINQQIKKDIYRGIDIKINDEDVNNSVTTNKGDDYIAFIDSKLSGISEKELYAVKSLLNQFPISVASDIMIYMLPKYNETQIHIYPIKPDIIDIYKNIFPDINDSKILDVKENKNKIILDETHFTTLMVVDYSNKNPDLPIEIVGVGKAVVYCDFDKNIGFFIWKSVIKEARTSINNIILGSIGAAVVATGAVVGTLFGVGVLGGKSKKKKKTRKTIRKKRKTRRKTITKR